MGIFFSAMANVEQKGALAEFIAEDMADLKAVLKEHQERIRDSQKGNMTDFYREKYRARYMGKVDTAVNVKQQQDAAASPGASTVTVSQRRSSSRAGENSTPVSTARVNDGRWPLEQGPKNGGSPKSWRFSSQRDNSLSASHLC